MSSRNRDTRYELNLRSCEHQAQLVWRNTFLVLDLPPVSVVSHIMVGVVLCPADALCRAHLLRIVSIVVVQDSQLSPSVALMVIASSMQPQMPQLLPVKLLAIVVKHHIEHESPTFSNI